MKQRKELVPYLSREALEEMKSIYPSLKEEVITEERMKELCYEFVKVSESIPYLLGLIYFPNEDLCKLAVERNGANLEYVPKKYITKQLCETAINTCGMALEFVPKEFKTLELCIKAVTNSGSALEFVPVKFRTEEVCNIAVKNCGVVISEIENPSITLCMGAVKQSGYALGHIINQTIDLCYEALLTFIRDELLTIDVIKTLMFELIKDNKVANYFIDILNKYERDIPSLNIVKEGI